ncbi:MAG: putative porin [Proteobacteria bacterium]|nr:putative porin [Pseudomonadota bacterium]
MPYRHVVLALLLAYPCLYCAPVHAASAEENAALIRTLQQQLGALQAELAALRRLVAAADAYEPPAGAAAGPPPDDTAVEISGDFRVRYENTSEHAGLRERNRGVIRGRLGADWDVNDNVVLGTRIGTGDPDDPNSTDISMGNFLDDLDLSLDRLYVAYERGKVFATAGKFANPFVRTSLVWDSDVNPYGVAGRYRFYASDRASASVTGIYALVDEQTIAGDSTMAGAQLSLRWHPDTDWALGLHGAYYDYSIGSLDNADRGDLRGNNVTPGGARYVSDFRLLNLTGSVMHSGIGERWPLALTLDYVRNLGARVPEDTGWGVDLHLGRTSRPGDLQFRYGYAVAETDAVLAAFSHDNTTYSTNYRQHTLELGYLLQEKTGLYLTTYLYRRDAAPVAGQAGDDDWVSRVRMNLHYTF